MRIAPIQSEFFMPRLTLAIVALIGILAGGLGVSLATKLQPVADDAAMRTIVSEVLAEREVSARAPAETAAIDPAQLNPMIENYLMSDPRILERMSTALQTEQRTAQAEESKAAIAGMRDAIFNDPEQIVLGNPNGDVTLVEMFDYNCGYCRQALPNMATLLAEDPNLKIVLKEFPILSKESTDAARVAVLVGRSNVDYWAFHQALFSSRGQVTGETALVQAQALGLNRITLELEMNSAPVAKTIQRSYDIAKALNITGTPTYIIGNEIIPGAIGIDELRSRIANMRACGNTACPG
jgi:protein-disulfide isomerase